LQAGRGGYRGANAGWPLARIEELDPEKFERSPRSISKVLSTQSRRHTDFSDAGHGRNVVVVSSKNVFDPGRLSEPTAPRKREPIRWPKSPPWSWRSWGAGNLVNPDAVFGTRKYLETVGAGRARPDESTRIGPKGLGILPQRNLLKVQVTAEHVGTRWSFRQRAHPTTGATLPLTGEFRPPS